MESLAICSKVPIDKLYNAYLCLNTTYVPKRQLTGYFKTANSLFLYHKYYKLLDMMILNKMLNIVRTFSL